MSPTEFVQMILESPPFENSWETPKVPPVFADELERLLPRTFLVSRNLEAGTVVVVRLPPKK